MVSGRADYEWIHLSCRVSTMLPAIFDAFVKASPVSVMARGVMERFLNPDRLNAWFEEVSDKQYTRDLLFSSLFGLISQVVCGSHKSVHAAYQASPEEIGVSVVAVYDKLKRMETETSAALVRYAVSQATPLIEALGGAQDPLLPAITSSCSMATVWLPVNIVSRS